MFLRLLLGRLKRSCVHPSYSHRELYWGNGRVIHQPAKWMETRNNFLKTTLTSYLSHRRRGSSSPLIMKFIWLRDPRGSRAPRNGQRPASSLFIPVKKRNPITTPLPRQPIYLTCSPDVHHRLPRVICKPPRLTERKTSRLESTIRHSRPQLRHQSTRERDSRRTLPGLSLRLPTSLNEPVDETEHPPSSYQDLLIVARGPTCHHSDRSTQNPPMIVFRRCYERHRYTPSTRIHQETEKQVQGWMTRPRFR